MKERAHDRYILFRQYNDDLSLINPYEKYHENDCNKSLIERYAIEKEIKDTIKKNRSN